MKLKGKLVVAVSLMLVLMLSGSVLAGSAGEVELWSYWTAGVERESLNAFVEVVEGNYPVEVNSRDFTGPEELRRQLGAALMTGNPPETYQSAPGYDLKRYVDAGHLEPINDVWERIDGDNVIPDGLIEIVEFDGNIYAVPINMHIISHIFYNKQIFDEYDLAPPTTWEEFGEVVSTLEENGVQALTRSTEVWGVYEFYPAIIEVLGVEGYMDLGRGNIAFDGPEMKEVFEFYRDNIVSAHIDGWSHYQWADAANPMVQGEAAMYLMGDWLLGLLNDAGWVEEQDYDFFPAPGTEDLVVAQVDVFPLLSGSNVEAGGYFLEAAGSVEGQEAFNNVKGSLASNTNVEPDFYSPLMKKTFDRVEAADDVLPNQMFLLPPALFEELYRQVERFAMEPTDEMLEDVTSTLETERQRILNQDGFIEWDKIN